MDKEEAKHKVREGEKPKKKKKASRDKRQERWGHRRGMLMEGADTKKGTDFRAAVEEEQG